jgi:hypothetical protein
MAWAETVRKGLAYWDSKSWELWRGCNPAIRREPSGHPRIGWPLPILNELLPKVPPAASGC